MNSSGNFVHSMYHLFNGYIYKFMYLRYAQYPSKHLVLIYAKTAVTLPSFSVSLPANIARPLPTFACQTA